MTSIALWGERRGMLTGVGKSMCGDRGLRKISIPSSHSAANLKLPWKKKVSKKNWFKKKKTTKLLAGSITREGPPAVLTGRTRNHFLSWVAGPLVVFSFEMYML